MRRKIRVLLEGLEKLWYLRAFISSTFYITNEDYENYQVHQEFQNSNYAQSDTEFHRISTNLEFLLSWLRNRTSIEDDSSSRSSEGDFCKRMLTEIGKMFVCISMMEFVSCRERPRKHTIVYHASDNNNSGDKIVANRWSVYRGERGKVIQWKCERKGRPKK